MKLDRNEILEYQQNRDPYLMIDEATEVIQVKVLKVLKIEK